MVERSRHQQRILCLVLSYRKLHYSRHKSNKYFIYRIHVTKLWLNLRIQNTLLLSIQHWKLFIHLTSHLHVKNSWISCSASRYQSFTSAMVYKKVFRASFREVRSYSVGRCRQGAGLIPCHQICWSVLSNSYMVNNVKKNDKERLRSHPHCSSWFDFLFYAMRYYITKTFYKTFFLFMMFLPANKPN